MRQLIAIGSLSVVKVLVGAGLADRLRLVVFPQILGSRPVSPRICGT